MLFVAAFLSRLGFGMLADRIGPVRTLLIGSVSMATMLLVFAFATSYTGLFVAALLFGLGFSGIMPCYPLLIRVLFPVSQLGGRIAAQYMFAAGGMALGGWLGGVIFDLTGSYSPAFLVAFGFNAMNFVVMSFFHLRQTRLKLSPRPA